MNPDSKTDCFNQQSVLFIVKPLLPPSDEGGGFVAGKAGGRETQLLYVSKSFANCPSATYCDSSPDKGEPRRTFLIRPTDCCLKQSVQSVICKPTFGIYTKLVYPIKYASISFAAALPSAIAHTTSDCPRWLSPAVNSLSTFVL